MAGIEKYLNTIKNGVFGRDVRKAIHDGIEQVYNDAAKNGNANMEVAKARGSSPTLSDRLAQNDQVVADVFAKILTQSAQIENVIASSGDGTLPTELVDVRTLSSGKTYATAGEATRAIDERIKDMPKTIKNIISNVQIGKYWSNSSIGQDGTVQGANADYVAYTIEVEPGSSNHLNI